jgi:mRNA-degrading endonuclease YafQ of YafQ-DinJ toxin-antitoxin module
MRLGLGNVVDEQYEYHDTGRVMPYKRYTKTLDKLLLGLSREKRETKEMIETFFSLLTHRLPKGRKPEEHELQAALEQLKDVHKIAGLLLVAMTPGSVVTLPALCALGRRFGIEFLPSSFQGDQLNLVSKELVEDLPKTLTKNDTKP